MNEEATTVARRERAMITRPAWLQKFESRVARRVPLPPNVLSGLKLILVTPALLWVLSQASLEAPGFALALALALFAAFALLDYLDGLVAREKNLATGFGRVFDRVTDYPLLLGVSYFCKDVVPPELVIAKVVFDVALLLLFVMGRGSTQNRLRTALSYATLLGLMLSSQGWASTLISPATVRHLLSVNIAFTAIVMLYNLNLLQKRHVANLLSMGNLACGLLGIVAAWQGAPLVSLLLLIAGVTLDGFDGVAARRWGSTSWGVYADDVADGVNFALAPAAVLGFAVGGVSGVLMGVLFAVCTIGRLVYFTLDHGKADGRYFSGVPSSVGALIVLCAAILFPEQPEVMGLLVGVACMQMVSFATAYRHLGRLLADRPHLLWGPPAVGALLAASWWAFGVAAPVAGLLLLALGYTLQPPLRAFSRVVARPHAADIE